MVFAGARTSTSVAGSVLPPFVSHVSLPFPPISPPISRWTTEPSVKDQTFGEWMSPNAAGLFALHHRDVLIGDQPGTDPVVPELRDVYWVHRTAGG